MHGPWLPYYVEPWFRNLLFSFRVQPQDCTMIESNCLCLSAQVNTGRTVLNLRLSFRILCIFIQIVMRVCGTLFSLRDLFSYCPILVSNFLSHTAQFSTGRKVWKCVCLLSTVVRFSTDHGQSLRQTAGMFCSYRVPFSPGLAIRSPGFFVCSWPWSW